MRYPLLFLILIAACSDDAPRDQAFELSDDVSLQLAANGEAVLSAAGRETFALASGGFVLRTYAETPRASVAIWDFRRREVVDVALQRVGAASESGGIVSIPYADENGEYRAHLEIEARASSTRFAFVVDARLAPPEGHGDSIVMRARCDEAGSFHGFGEQYDARDQRGEAFDLLAEEQGIGRTGVRSLAGDDHTTYFPMPYWLDGRGFGVLMQTDRRVRVDLCATDPNVAAIEVTRARGSAEGDTAEWLVFHGPTPRDVVRQLGDEVGRPAALPTWAFGAWMAGQGGRDIVLAEVDALIAADIPFSALWVQDWTGIRMNIGGGFGVEYRWEHDESLYPDLPGMVDELHERDIRFLAYANPFVDPDLPNHFDEMDARGLLLRSEDGESYVFSSPSGTSAHPDLSHEPTRAYVREALSAMVRDYGFDGWMQDFGEWSPLDAMPRDGSTAMEFHNRFPVMWQQIALEVMREQRPDGDFAIFGRSGWTGVQGVSQIHWVGDQEADFQPSDGLPTVVPAMLGLGLAGQPNVTHDIAGFSGGPSTKELFMRWTELGAFTPIFRTHDGNNRDENWGWDRDPETTAHFRRFARIHEVLRPLFEAAAARSQETSQPIVEHLMLAFPDETELWNVDDEYLLGEELLVAPVVREGAVSREVRLPSGVWFHVWTGERFEGPTTIAIDAPLGAPPVFSRERDRPELRAIE